MCDITGILNCDTSAPGVAQTFHIIPAEEILTQPGSKYDASPGTAVVGDKKRYNAAFTYVPTSKKGYWRKFKAIIGSGKGDQALVGEGGSAGFENGFAFKLSGNDAEVREFADSLVECSKCGGVLVAIENPETGDRDIIGNLAFPAVLKAANLSTGEGVAKSARESTFTIAATNGKTKMIYPKTLALNITPNP